MFPYKAVGRCVRRLRLVRGLMLKRKQKMTLRHANHHHSAGLRPFGRAVAAGRSLWNAVLRSDGLFRALGFTPPHT